MQNVQFANNQASLYALPNRMNIIGKIKLKTVNNANTQCFFLFNMSCIIVRIVTDY